MSDVRSLLSDCYWRPWIWWHQHFEWCLCSCDYCGHRFVHTAACGGTSRLRRRA